MLGKFSRRFVAGFAGLAVTAGLLGLAPAARAADVPNLGQLFLNPTTGPVTGLLDLSTKAPCPTDGESPSVNVKVSVTGQGINDTSQNNLLGLTSLSATTPNDQGGFTVNAAIPLKEIFQAYAITAPTGQYVINLRCQNSNGSVIRGDFLTTINMVPNGTAFEGTFTVVPPTPNGVATVTTLAQPTSPIKNGAATTLTATVDKTAATGTIQFKDGATNLGEAVPVAAGTATKTGVTLLPGSHSLTAVFTSSDLNAFQSSTSTAKTVFVAGVPGITGTPQVGKTVTCTTSALGAPAFSWLVNGSIAANVKARSVVVPATWAAKSVACRATYTGTQTIVQVSAAKKIALGGKLVARIKPKVVGTAKVGKVLTCSRGTWTPAAGVYKYQWLRGTAVLKGKTTAKYKAVKADKGKKISCKVTAVKTGYVSGLAAAPARKVL